MTDNYSHTHIKILYKIIYKHLYIACIYIFPCILMKYYLCQT